MSNPLFFLKVDCILHWGWRLNLVPFSKSRPPLLAPPPTTLIGALAYPLSRSLKLPEAFGEYSGAERLRGSLKYVGLKIDLPLINYFDLSKITFFYRKKAERDAVAIGKTYTLSKGLKYEAPTITICYVVDEEVARRSFSREKVRKKLVEAAIGITRIGSRESLVTPLSLSYGEARPITQRRGKTSFSFMRRSISNLLSGDFMGVEVVDWEKYPIGDYYRAGRELMIIPYDSTEYVSKPVEVELSEDYTFVDVGGELVIARRGA
jgi:CRISPR-associated protein Cas5a/b/c